MLSVFRMLSFAFRIMGAFYEALLYGIFDNTFIFFTILLVNVRKTI